MIWSAICLIATLYNHTDDPPYARSTFSFKTCVFHVTIDSYSGHNFISNNSTTQKDYIVIILFILIIPTYHFHKTDNMEIHRSSCPLWACGHVTLHAVSFVSVQLYFTRYIMIIIQCVFPAQPFLIDILPVLTVYLIDIYSV